MANTETTKKQQAVDRGYAWVILGACFVMYLTVGGPNKSYGILYAELLAYYRSGSGNTAWIGSICSVLSHCLGPVSNLLSRRFSYRTVTLIGGFLYGLGHVTTGLVPRIEYMFFTYGILCGFGLGLLVPPTVTIVNFYFDKRRSLANGIVISASGVGTFIYPFFYRYLIATYGLKGALWILGAIFCHSCVGACLLREPSYKDPDEASLNEDYCVEVTVDEVKGEEAIQASDGLLSANSVRDLGSLEAIGNPRKISEEDTHSWHGDRLQLPKPRRRDLLHLYVSDSIEAIALSASMRSLDHQRHDTPTHTDTEEEPSPRSPLSGSLTTQDKSKRFSNSSEHVVSLGKKLCDACCRKLPNFKVSLFLNPRFSLHVVTIMLCVSAYSNNQMIIPAHVAHMGLGMDSAALCVSVMGACDLVARLVFGYFADRKCIERKHIVMCNVFIIGSLSFIVPQVTSLTVFAVYSGVTGSLLGTTWSLSPALIVDVVGMEDFSHAFGLLVFCIGCAFIAQPIAGWLEDLTGNWHASFYFTGCMLFVSGSAMILDTLYRRYCKKDEPRGQKST